LGERRWDAAELWDVLEFGSVDDPRLSHVLSQQRFP
jgi:hypothetical protein